MIPAADQSFSDLAMLVAIIAHSQIVFAQPRPARKAVRQLPAGFEDVDIAILDWIAAEGSGRNLLPM
jgi:hypothetical protein